MVKEARGQKATPAQLVCSVHVCRPAAPTRHPQQQLKTEWVLHVACLHLRPAQERKRHAPTKRAWPLTTSRLPCRSHQRAGSYHCHSMGHTPSRCACQTPYVSRLRQQLPKDGKCAVSDSPPRHTRHMCACAYVEERSTTHAEALHMPDRTTHSPHPHYKGAPMHRINRTGTTHTSRDTAST